MSRKIYPVLLLAYILFPSLKAQQLTWSSQFEVPGGLYDQPYVFGDDNNYLYVFYGKEYLCYVDKINKNSLVRERSSKIAIKPGEGAFFKHHSQVVTGNSVILFYSKIIDSKVALCCIRLGDNIPLSEDTLISVKGDFFAPVPAIFTVVTSPDKEKLAIMMMNWNKKTSHYEYLIALFDDQLKLLSQWTAENDVMDWYSINGLSLDHNGNVYYLKSTSDGRSWLVSFHGDKHDKRELFLDLSEQATNVMAIPSGLNLYNENLLVAGSVVSDTIGEKYLSFYSNRMIKGTFAISVDILTNTVKFRKVNLFEETVKVKQNYFQPCVFHCDSLGNFTLVNEIIYDLYLTSTYGYTFVSYHSADGDLRWSVKLPIYFSPDRSNYDAFWYLVKHESDGVHVFMNDPVFDESINPKVETSAEYKSPIEFIINGPDKIQIKGDIKRSLMMSVTKTITHDYLDSNGRLYFIAKKGKYYKISSQSPAL